jgi:DNA-binding NarL/FixJ family response regulator
MSISVLIVDDHTVVSEGLRSLIEAQADMRVVACVADGREAVTKAKELKPDVVLMDISMPDLNGIEATHLIRSRLETTQVVILSMHSNQEYVLRALQAGARGYVLKKSASKEVVDAIRTVHQGGRYLSQKLVDGAIDDLLRDGSITNPLDALSSRERQVLQLLVEGKSNAVIARTLSLSPKTVETYRARVMQKLNIDDIPNLVKFAIQHGVTPLE